MKLKDFVNFNPKETLIKNHIYRKISMDQLSPFTRNVHSINFEKYSGGTKFKNEDTIFARITPCLENGKTSFISCLDENEIAFGSTEFIVVRSKKDISLPLFAFYLMNSSNIRNRAIISMTGSSGRERVQQIALDNIDIPNYSIAYQQHIVNTIGSVDDLIENYQSQIDKIFQIGKNKINYLNNNFEMDKFSIYSRFEKGSEVGSNNYNEVKLENSIPYIRVADLNNKSTTFINSSNSKNIAMDDDILIAFDGAPGRNCIGLSGAFSSGIYKVNSDPIYKGLLYFELNSIENQKIIKDYSQGTTILHASKAIPLLKSIKASDETVQYFSNLFNYIVVLKRKMTLLKTCKELLLSKYFTNQ